MLKDRWSQAKQSALSPRHVKIEKFCSTCLLRTLGGNTTCRGCHGDLASGMKILPGQWPPLNCPSHLLQRFEGETPAPTNAPPETGDIPMQGGDHGCSERPMQHLPLSQLRQEKLKLEKHILELPVEGFSNLRDQLEITLAMTVKEIKQRKPAGQSLDQALSRHKAAVRARSAVEEHLKQAEEAVTRAQQALQTAKEAELQMAQEVSKVRNSIAEDEGCELIKGPTIPSNIVAGIYQILHSAGLHPTHLAAIANVMGSPAPPPPAAAGQPLPPGAGMDQANAANGCTAGNAPAAGLARATAENHALTGPTALPTGAEPPPLAHPARLASQLLAGRTSSAPPGSLRHLSDVSGILFKFRY